MTETEPTLMVTGQRVATPMSDASGAPRHGPGGRSTLVGRAGLVDRACHLLELDGNVLLFGDEGSGRTAVLHEVARRSATSQTTVALIDGSGVHDAPTLLALILHAMGVGVSPGDDVPLMLASIDRVAGASSVIAIDDLETAAAQELFGRWRRHLWRLHARCVAVAAGDDPSPYLDGGANAWWEDGVLPLPTLERADARDMVEQYLRSIGVAGDVPDELLRSARGLPRELLRQARGLALSQRLHPDEESRSGDAGAGVWAVGAAQPAAPYELSPQESLLMTVVRDRGAVSLADQSVHEALRWSYGKTHRLLNELVERGLVQRRDVPGELGRPRVVYSAVASR